MNITDITTTVYQAISLWRKSKMLFIIFMAVLIIFIFLWTIKNLNIIHGNFVNFILNPIKNHFNKKREVKYYYKLRNLIDKYQILDKSLNILQWNSLKNIKEIQGLYRQIQYRYTHYIEHKEKAKIRKSIRICSPLFDYVGSDPSNNYKIFKDTLEKYYSSLNKQEIEESEDFIHSYSQFVDEFKKVVEEHNKLIRSNL